MAGRRLVEGLLAGALITLAGCSGDKGPSQEVPIETPPPNPTHQPTGPVPTATREPTRTPEPTPTPTPTETPIPTSTPEPTFTPIPTWYEADREIVEQIQSSQEGDLITLRHPFVSHLAKIDLPGGYEFVYARLAIEDEEGVEGLAVIHNADCLLDELQQTGLLGDQLDLPGAISSGVYEPNVRLAEMKGEVDGDASAGSVPLIQLQEVQISAVDQAVTCPFDSNVGEIGGLLGDLWDKAQEKAAEIFEDLVQMAEEQAK